MYNVYDLSLYTVYPMYRVYTVYRTTSAAGQCESAVSNRSIQLYSNAAVKAGVKKSGKP